MIFKLFRIVNALLIVVLGNQATFAQNTEELQLVFPQQENWNVVDEGEKLSFKLEGKGGLTSDYRFGMIANELEYAKFDSAGNFSWIPSYNLISEKEGKKSFPIIFELSNKGGQSVNRQVEIIVNHVNTFPNFISLEPFYVEPEKENKYELNLTKSVLPRQDSIEYIVNSSELPVGFIFSQLGELFWKPTQEQWEKLIEKPFKIDFLAINNTNGDKTEGKLEVKTRVESQPKPEVARTEALKLQLPHQYGWNFVNEGEPIQFKLSASGGSGKGYTYKIQKGSVGGISFDSFGNFYWEPDYDVVDRLEETKNLQVIFEVQDDKGHAADEKVDLVVRHTNRPPVVNELPTFYVQYNVKNTYQLSGHDAIFDEDNDPFVFKPVLSEIPQGMELNEKGELTWKPSTSQYYQVRKEPMDIPFLVEDQPYKGQTQGHLRIEVTQIDLPPEISVFPNASQFIIKEDETINLKFYLTDPNGDQDIVAFDFVSENNKVPKSALVKNTPNQYEFVWEPGYNYFIEPGDTGSFNMIFFVIDQANNRKEKKIKVTVSDAENLLEKDRLLYSQYRTGLLRVWDLLEELREKEKFLRKKYDKAKKGKMTRAITSASLGAVTGLSPVFLEGQNQKVTSGIGGTASMTLGTLEASRVIGDAPSDIMEQLSLIVQKISELQIQGDIFASLYALSSSRRANSFSADLKKVIELTNAKDLSKLGLDGNWKNSKKSTDQNIKKAFKDFNPSDEYNLQE